MTARGLTILARETIRRFPELYKIYAETTYTYNDIKQSNRNPLLYKGMGADGLKTGHTENAGYGLTASAVRGDRRLILVVNGLEQLRQRSSESERLLEWGFREFDNYRLFERGEVVDNAGLWLGVKPSVPLVVDEDVMLSMARTARRDMRVSIEYDGPIPAPVVAGQVLAWLRVAAPDMADHVVELRAGENVGKLGPVGRLTSAVGHLILGPSASD